MRSGAREAWGGFRPYAHQRSVRARTCRRAAIQRRPQGVLCGCKKSQRLQRDLGERAAPFTKPGCAGRAASDCVHVCANRNARLIADIRTRALAEAPSSSSCCGQVMPVGKHGFRITGHRAYGPAAPHRGRRRLLDLIAEREKTSSATRAKQQYSTSHPRPLSERKSSRVANTAAAMPGYPSNSAAIQGEILQRPAPGATQSSPPPPSADEPWQEVSRHAR